MAHRLVRMGCHQPTRDYVARRTGEGKTTTEIMRCLKRYIAREVFPHLVTAAPRADSVATAAQPERLTADTTGQHTA